MAALIDWLRERLGQAPAVAPRRRLSLEESVPCRVCEGSGQCRVCGGAGEIERLVAQSGGDSAALGQEPVKSLTVLKCHACPRSSGICRACGGEGRVLIDSPRA